MSHPVAAKSNGHPLAFSRDLAGAGQMLDPSLAVSIYVTEQYTPLSVAAFKFK